MDTIQTPDGVFYIWDTQRDFSDLCRKYISDDAANYIDAVIADVDTERDYEIRALNDEINGLEYDVEYYRDELFDIKEQLEHISYEAEQKPGLSKRKILDKIDEMWSHLQKIL